MLFEALTSGAFDHLNCQYTGEFHQDFLKQLNARGFAGAPIHYLYGYVPPKGVMILKLLIQNGVSISEAFSRTGYNISNVRKLHFCKQPFESIQGQITFKNTVQCVNKQTVVLLLHPRTEYKKLAHFQNSVSVLGRMLEQGIKNWPISRTGYQFQGKFLQNGVPIWSPGRHIPTQKIPKCTPREQSSQEKLKTMLVQSFGG